MGSILDKLKVEYDIDKINELKRKNELFKACEKRNTVYVKEKLDIVK